VDGQRLELVASRVTFEDNVIERNDLRNFVGHPEAEWHCIS
jgi:hypothetical protein